MHPWIDRPPCVQWIRAPPLTLSKARTENSTMSKSFHFEIHILEPRGFQLPACPAMVRRHSEYSIDELAEASGGGAGADVSAWLSMRGGVRTQAGIVQVPAGVCISVICRFVDGDAVTLSLREKIRGCSSTSNLDGLRGRNGDLLKSDHRRSKVMPRRTPTNRKLQAAQLHSRAELPSAQLARFRGIDSRR